jgi:hypothetical protein
LSDRLYGYARRKKIYFVEWQLEQANERDRENRRIDVGLAQHVPELEAVPELRDIPETSSGDFARVVSHG